MTARRIHLSPAESRGLLAGRVSLLLRPVTLRANDGKCCSDCLGVEPEKAWADPGLGAGGYLKVPCRDGAAQRVYCPFGVPGDALWGAEAWMDVHPLLAEGRYSQPGRGGIPGPPPVDYRAVYRADGEVARLFHAHAYPWRTLTGEREATLEGGWNPSTHMKPEQSRHALKLASVRVVRVRDITMGDVSAAGFCACEEFAGCLREAWTARYGARYPWETAWAWALEVAR